MSRLAFFILLLTSLTSWGVYAQSLGDLYQKVKSSVVIIETETGFITDDNQMTFGGSQGSGVLISEDGQILTAAHVVSDAENINVIFHDGEVVPAEIIRLSLVADVALIKLLYAHETKKYPIARLGDSDQMRVGDDIFVIGAPFGLDYSLSKGIISGISTEKSQMAGFTFAEFFQTDAAINQGNSGGPMFNMDGEVIGLVSYIVTESGGFDGIGFAATSNITEFLVVDSDRRWTGINGILLDPQLANILNVPQPGGMLIQHIVPLSPAFMSGLKGGTNHFLYEDREILIGGDIILDINGIKITDEESIAALIRSIVLSPEEDRKQFTLTVLRGGQKKQLTLSLEP